MRIKPFLNTIEITDNDMFTEHSGRESNVSLT
jgi:hypothetical protein